MSKNKKNNVYSEQLMVEGVMTFGMLKNGLRMADFMCCEDVETEPFISDFRVQGMRDGNVYMQQKPKRVRNKAIFRDDNASLSHGQDGKWYFYFSLDDERIGELPNQLVRQAKAIAQKVERELIRK